jgi:DNA-binding protein HU-beta
MVGLMVRSLKKGERLRFSALGIAGAQACRAHGPKARYGRDDKVKASKKVAFHAAKELEEAI